MKKNGRPKKGERSACGAVAAEIGCSIRTVKRALAQANGKQAQAPKPSRRYSRLRSDVARHLRSEEVQGHDGIRELLKEVMQRIEQARKP